MNALTIVALVTFSLEITLILCLTFVPNLGLFGKNLIEAITKAPGLDLLVSLMLWIPWLIGALWGGIWGIMTAVAVQIATMQLWIFVHELVHRNVVRGPRIVSFLNQQIGWWRNHIALWSTIIVVPAFCLIRLAQVTVYPILIWALGFPNYKHSDWINVSRHKFQGLVGHDLIWCLYCDWMTGVYALGAEMLRNVESFWCPIRFYSDKKCENCQREFPDLNDWVAVNGDMQDVEQLLQNKYSDRVRSWFGHPDRKQ
ncbi:hypothetical protein Sta7437_0029 [Stanieria cyanosphaera PCC 7437]|uniref:Uncharacterized protein n=1 Tax=Stanieria cyanosphaera (strain ATCC 29371 / PCC 7437) TaxID=111780 RepID=K9XM28_STAC7|nr:hypothetical protein [Stanieria cyanosphaera]AFZ33655.1 hypothetical protein Sta7437_0029 [Stanieria cyanosphaera PCC 7437]